MPHCHAEEVEVWHAEALAVHHGLNSALDEKWSDVHSKAKPRWFWHAIAHHTRRVSRYADDGRPPSGRRTKRCESLGHHVFLPQRLGCRRATCEGRAAHCSRSRARAVQQAAPRAALPVPTFHKPEDIDVPEALLN
jgi:hypothetical protein